MNHTFGSILFSYIWRNIFKMHENSKTLRTPHLPNIINSEVRRKNWNQSLNISIILKMWIIIVVSLTFTLVCFCHRVFEIPSFKNSITTILCNDQSCMKITKPDTVCMICCYLLSIIVCFIDFLATKYTNYKRPNQYFKRF